MLDPVRNLPPPDPRVADVGPEQMDPMFVREAHRVAHFYVRFVRRYRVLLVGLPAAAAVVAFGLTWMQPRTYEATVTMMAAGEDAEPATYLPYVQNHRIADQVIREFKLNEPPHRMTRTKFLESELSANAIRNTNLLSMSLTLRDPQTVAGVLNRISKEAIDLVRRTNMENALAMRELLRAQLDEARDSLQQATANLLQYREGAQIELLKKDIDAALTERGQLLALSAQIEELRSKLTRAQADLATRSRVSTLNRTIDESPLLQEAARAQGGSKGSESSSVVGLQVRSDDVNPVYDALDEQVATAQAQLAGLERKRDQLVRADGLAAPRLKKLSELYSAESELARLELDRMLREKVFSEVSNRYELTRLDVAKHGELIVIDPALPPDRPVARGTVVNVALAALAGLCLALAIVVLGRPH